MSRALSLRQRAAQDFARRLGAVDEAERPPFDLPARRRAQEVPAVGHHAVDMIAARGAMIGNLDRFPRFFRRQNLQIRNNNRAVAVNCDVRQTGEMRKPARDRGLMSRALQARGDGLVADGPGEVRPPRSKTPSSV